MSGPDFYGCYFPDHSPAYNHTSCNAGAAQSWCCAMDTICLGNGYCQQTYAPWSNRLARHSCTDKTWSSGACPSFCSDTRPTDSVGLYLAWDRPGGGFCCEFNVNTTTRQCQNATKNSYEPFNLPDGPVIWNRSSGATIGKSGSILLTDLNLGSTNNESTAATTSATASTAATSSAAAAVATITSNSNIAPIAAGIAVPLAVLLLAALIACGFLFSQNRKLRKEKQEMMDRPEASQYGGQSNMAMSPAPVYEYKPQPSASTNWAPYTPQPQTAQPHGDYMSQSPPPAPYYAAPPPHPAHAVEASSEQIGELSADEIRKPGFHT